MRIAFAVVFLSHAVFGANIDFELLPIGGRRWPLFDVSGIGKPYSAVSSARPILKLDKVDCLGTGMNVTLKKLLPIPISGSWDLVAEGFEDCPWARKSDIKGGSSFFIAYATDTKCGVSPKSYFEPAIVSNAKVTLLLEDNNGTKIGDYISCVYKTRFSHSLSFSDVRSENLIYQGTLEKETVEVENTVQASDSINMDFFSPEGEALSERVVKMGEPLVFKIDVSESEQVTRVLPEKCYFSPSPNPDFTPDDGTLNFVTKSCFNEKSGVVNQMLPIKMERNGPGTTYHLDFQAFYFTNYGSNLYVHCMLLACIGDQSLCQPKDEMRVKILRYVPGCRLIPEGWNSFYRYECFSLSRRRKREVETPKTNLEQSDKVNKEMIMTKFIFVEDQTSARATKPTSTAGNSLFDAGAVCLDTPKFALLFGSMGVAVMVLLVSVSCLCGRLANQNKVNTAPSYRDMPTLDTLAQKHAVYHSYTSANPPSYTTGLPTITPF